jgi:8-oxo-dGTP diphosphatase
MSFTYKYARPAITTDCVVFTRDKKGLKVLLIQRRNEPFKGRWALPGGFAESGECLEDTARRELQEETGLKGIPLKQFHTFSDPNRDPREHVITVAYYAVISLEKHHVVRASDDASEAAWFYLDALPGLAFDHDKILSAAHNLIGNERS